jgi:hypothetical protein
MTPVSVRSFKALDEYPDKENLLWCALSARHREGEDAMPFRVILFEKNREIGSKVWETEAEAITHAKTTPPQLEAISVIVVDNDTNEIVFTEHVTELYAQMA